MNKKITTDAYLKNFSGTKRIIYESIKDKSQCYKYMSNINNNMLTDNQILDMCSRIQNIMKYNLSIKFPKDVK